MRFIIFLSLFAVSSFALATDKVAVYLEKHHQAKQELISHTVKGAEMNVIANSLVQLVKYETYLAGRGVFNNPEFISGMAVNVKSSKDLRRLGYEIYSMQIYNEFGVSHDPALILKNISYSQPYLH